MKQIAKYMPFAALLLVVAGLAVWIIAVPNPLPSSLPSSVKDDTMAKSGSLDNRPKKPHNPEIPVKGGGAVIDERSTTESQLERYHRLNDSLEKTKRDILERGVQLPDVSHIEIDREEIRRKIIKRMEDLHKRSTDPVYIKKKKDEAYYWRLRNRVKESRRIYGLFAEPPKEIEFSTEDSNRARFESEYIGAISKYFNETNVDTSEITQLFKLLKSIASYAGYEVGDENSFADHLPIGIILLWNGEARFFP